MPEKLRIAYAVAEVAPWCMTGGLGEVSGALPHALHELDVDVAVFFPLYRKVRLELPQQGAQLVDTGERVTVHLGDRRLRGRWWRIVPARPSRDPEVEDARELPIFAFDCPALFDRDGLYGHPDDGARFATFCRAMLHSVTRLMGGAPDLVHCHDWHTALIPVYLAGPFRPHLPHTATVLTLHNLAYQGLMSPDDLWTTGLDKGWFHMDALEFYGAVNLLKGGIVFADALTTVSPRYAEEIRTPEFGERLDGVLARHGGKLAGILNGIDVRLWDPAVDPLIPARYSADDLAGKAACRQNLLAAAGLDPHDPHPVFGVVSRFARQKGLDLVAELTPYLVQRNARLLVLGQGDKGLEGWFEHLQRVHPNHVRVRFGMAPGLAHEVQAAVDGILMPSRYEPCGLTQMYAMRYGTIPVVRAVGGLRDTVVDATPRHLADATATGYTFLHDDVPGLKWAVDRALEDFYTRPDVWRQLQVTGMQLDFTWNRSARQYVDVYRDAIRRRRR